MAPFPLIPISKSETRSLWAMLDHSPSHVLVEEAMLRREIGSTFSDQSIGSRWISNNVEQFVRLYPDVVQFLRDHQINPSTVYLLETSGIAAAISQADLVDTYGRIILRHMPVGFSWFTLLYSTADDKQSVMSIYFDWLDSALRTKQETPARSFFNRYSAGELELLPNTRDFTQPTNYRVVRGGSLWKLLSPEQITKAISMIIDAGHSHVVCQNWMTIRVWLIEQPNLVTRIGDMIVASFADSASITTEAQFVAVGSLTKKQKLAVLRHLRPEPARPQVPDGDVNRLSASFDLLLLLALVLDGDITQEEVSEYEHLLASSHPIVAYCHVRRYERAARGRHVGTWNQLATLAAASLERSVPAYALATTYWDDDLAAFCARIGDVIYVERLQDRDLDKRSGDEVIVPIVKGSTTVDVSYLIPIR